MPDVRMPDGTVIRNVPEGTTQAELTRRLGAAQQGGGGASIDQQVAGSIGRNFADPPSVAGARESTQRTQRNQRGIQSGLQSLGQGFAERTLGNAAQIPDVAANLGARAVNQAAAPFQSVANPGQTLQRLAGGGKAAQSINDPAQRQAPLIDTPGLEQDFIPGPTGEQLQGGVQRLGEAAGALRTGDFGQFQPGSAAEQQGALNGQAAEENPGAFFLGQISGDIMTLITGRAPIAKARGRSQLASREFARTAAESGPSQRVTVAPTVKSALEQATKGSSALRTLANRAGRAAETGLEGATLAVLNGEADPEQAFGFAAGTQAAGSLMLSGLSGLFRGGVVSSGAKLAVSAGAIGAIAQTLKSATPGGNNFILESIETGFDKVALGLAAGAISGLGGLGRVTNRFPVRALPGVADTITAIPRGAVLSTLNEMLEDPAVDAVILQVGNDPEFFGKTAQRRLERAINSKEDGAVAKAIEDLSSNREFSQKFEQIQGL